jgi:exopolyphosphatase/guanosine-5'-triphosphate,3'-diphosphate pyrophosphatase
MRLAAIDIGTNSIHMVIAEATHADTFTVLDREREVVQVGRGSFDAGRLHADAMQRTADALARFAQLARRHSVDRILCTATAAVREAKNGGDFLKLARRASGVAPRVIPSEEEGRLIHLAVQAALKLPEQPALIVDIGGGSVQLVHVIGAQLLKVVAVPLGALRLTETQVDHDPPTDDELEQLRRTVRKQLRRALDELGGPAPVTVYGSSGSIHALAELAHIGLYDRELTQLNGHVLELDVLADLTRTLERMSQEERAALPGIDEMRAEILVPGAIVLEQVLRLADAKAITLSDYGVREGLVMDWLGRHARELSSMEAESDVRMRSVLGLLGRFDASGKHARHVASLSLQLFDELAQWHGCAAQEREWLHFAALLHDLGSTIAYDGHAQHSAYIIRNGGLRGLTADEIEIVSLVARYHGGARPRKRRDETFAALRKRTRRTVRWLSAILRVAEGFDRSHYQLVRGLSVRRRGERLEIVADVRRHAQLEIWAGRRRAAGLERLLGQTVRVVPVGAEVANPRTRRASAATPPAPKDAAPRDAGRAAASAPPPPAASATPRTRATVRGRSGVPGASANPAGFERATRNGHSHPKPRLLPKRSASA